MTLHFTRDEYQARLNTAREALAEAGLSGLLMFRQESMYYLTGYDTFGYVHFQCMYLGADGALTLLTREPDRRQATYTSVVEDLCIWVDREDADPYRELREILRERGAGGEKLGIELEAYGLTAAKGFRLMRALEGFCSIEDHSQLVSRLRLVKSPAELAYVRRAAELADEALAQAEQLAGPGVFEGDILAAMHGAIYQGDGDDPANEFIIGSGPAALMCRYHSGRRRLDSRDQLTLEFAGVYRHYHACLMRTLLIGRQSPRQLSMHSAAVDALLAAREALKPGRPIGDVFDAHARVLDAAGLQPHRMNACGYSLGTTFAPNWMDWPMFYHGNPVEAALGMVFFIHIIVFDSDSDLAMTTGQTVEVAANGCVPLSQASLALVLR